MTLDEQTPSEEREFFVKNMDILIGQGNRNEKEIIFIDTEMHSFTNRLTNGIFVPIFRVNSSNEEHNILKSLLQYLNSFITPPCEDFRIKIKMDFNLLEKFNGFKQTQAFLKIKKTLEEAMDSTNNS